MTFTVGRPRHTPPRHEGLSPRDEILESAAQLFTERGFGATSTRRIAEHVGMRQASLYHHFENKDSILEALLMSTIEGTLETAERLRGAATSPAAELYALVRWDAGQLLAARWNLGALYTLPEVRGPRFAPFQRRRDRLRERYRVLARAVAEDAGGPTDPATLELPLRLAETAIAQRTDGPVGDPRPVAAALADAALRVLGARPEQAARAASRLPEPEPVP
ncbi:TetR/AcrR family transcriptional regulator [Nocardiopsis sp. HNM0947]|uniref:TetR/AcrR family transcriptional regulator n=1 Tax=Nocardiopsis coralli TaxID=2772213 RepID=A0ABR9P9Q9_9ACTN|nr:TetR/AcrR family transcriptional regulator [Nocardiopsis coralli]MBE3000559.1 TetR/AcrR family transcriptional regulator [Nocardiopsis coralli]